MKTYLVYIDFPGKTELKMSMVDKNLGDGAWSY